MATPDQLRLIDELHTEIEELGGDPTTLLLGDPEEYDPGEASEIIDELLEYKRDLRRGR